MVVALTLSITCVGRRSAFAWETEYGTKDGDWQALYLKRGTKLDPQAKPPTGFSGNEHAELADIALQSLGLTQFSMQGDSITITDLNASIIRKLKDTRTVVDKPSNSPLEQRTLPPIAHFSGIPDFSYSLYDWINKNTLCPALPPEAPNLDLCHGYFPGWLSAFNPSHFGSQATKNYLRLHGLALWLAKRANDMRGRLDEAGLQEYGDYVREAERMALIYEAVAQHFLQDRWSVGHMWGRYGAANYKQMGYKDLPNNVVVGAISGLIHGSESVTGLLDPMSSPPRSKDNSTLEPVRWRREKIVPGHENGYPGIGDHRLFDMYRGALLWMRLPPDTIRKIDEAKAHLGSFAKAADVASNLAKLLSDKKDWHVYPLDVTYQRSEMMRCSRAGWIAVIKEFGAAKAGGYGIDGLLGGFNETVPTLDGCFDTWATNAAIYQAWNNDFVGKNLSDTGRLVLEALIPAGYRAQLNAKVDQELRENITELKYWALKSYQRDPSGIDLAKDGLWQLGKSKPGTSPQYTAAEYLEPETLEKLDDGPTDKGLDKKTIWGFFNRAGADYWCAAVLKDQLKTLRGSQEPAKRFACSLLADRTYQGTDPNYVGPQSEKRTLDGKARSQQTKPICAYYATAASKYDEDLPTYLHAGYVGTAYERATTTSSRSVENWCDKIPVLDYVIDAGGDKFGAKDWVADVALVEGEAPLVTVTGHNLGNKPGRLWWAKRNKGANQEIKDIVSWTDRAISFRAPPKSEAADDYYVWLTTAADKKSVGHYLVRLSTANIDPCLVGDWEASSVALFSEDSKIKSGDGFRVTIKADGTQTIDYAKMKEFTIKDASFSFSGRSEGRITTANHEVRVKSIAKGTAKMTMISPLGSKPVVFDLAATLIPGGLGGTVDNNQYTCTATSLTYVGSTRGDRQANFPITLARVK
jgi:hypothetical protein